MGWGSGPRCVADALAGKFYQSKGLMKRYENAAELAQDTGLPLSALEATFKSHQAYADGREKDPFGKGEWLHPLRMPRVIEKATGNFDNATYTLDEPLLVAQMTPVVHYVRSSLYCSIATHLCYHCRQWAASLLTTKRASSMHRVHPFPAFSPLAKPSAAFTGATGSVARHYWRQLCSAGSRARAQRRREQIDGVGTYETAAKCVFV